MPDSPGVGTEPLARGRAASHTDAVNGIIAGVHDYGKGIRLELDIEAVRTSDPHR